MSRFGESFSTTNWFKSSYSSNAHACVEVALTSAAAGVRDSKDRAGGELTFSSDQWGSFVSALKEQSH